MGKLQTVLLATTASLALAASAAAFVIFQPGMPATSPSAPAEAAATSQPKLTLPADGFLVLTPEAAQPFPDVRKSQPNGTFDVLNGIPQGYPAGVPVQDNAQLNGARWHFDDKNYQFIFVGDEAAYNTLVDQFSYAEWKLVSDGEVVPGTRGVTFSNDVWEAQLLRANPTDGRDQTYTVNLKRLSSSE
jgi:hypothetical protein